jgi:hypothetical protein
MEIVRKFSIIHSLLGAAFLSHVDDIWSSNKFLATARCIFHDIREANLYWKTGDKEVKDANSEGIKITHHTNIENVWGN